MIGVIAHENSSADTAGKPAVDTIGRQVGFIG